MEMIQTLLFVLQVLVAVALIGIVLIQHGKGADAGAAFGSGSSATVFGSHGSGGFITKLTTLLATIFLANSLALAYLASQKIKTAPTSLLDKVETVIQQEAPAIEQNQDLPIVEENTSSDADMPMVPVK